MSKGYFDGWKILHISFLPLLRFNVNSLFVNIQNSFYKHIKVTTLFLILLLIIRFLFTVVSWLPVPLVLQVTGPRATTVNMIRTIVSLDQTEGMIADFGTCLNRAAILKKVRFSKKLQVSLVQYLGPEYSTVLGSQVIVAKV